MKKKRRRSRWGVIGVLFKGADCDMTRGVWVLGKGSLVLDTKEDVCDVEKVIFRSKGKSVMKKLSSR